MALTSKQERFAIEYVQCGSATEAHRLAGYGPRMTDKTRNEAASRLLANSKIVARISELRGGHVERHNDHVDGLIAQFEEIRTRALVKGQLGAAVSAVTGKVKLYGLNDGPQTIDFPLDPIKDAEDAKARTAEVMQGLSDGRLRPSEAKALCDVLEVFRRQLDTVEVREMILELEETLKRLTR